MSAIHMRQIRAFLMNNFDALIDLSDYAERKDGERESAFLTRALAAFAIMSLADTDAPTAATHVTDGFTDNGLDAVFFEKQERILYLVQSKWDQDGAGSLARAHAQKFIKGFRDLIAPHLDRFNEKIQAKADMINEAISDARTRIFLVVIYSGRQPLSDTVKSDFQDVLKEMNDPTEVVTLKTLRQVNIYNMISHGAGGAPIDLDVALYEWGQIREPHQAYYGQVSASDVGAWWDQHYPRLFAPNIRMFLGDTDVNQGIIDTLRTAPESFWFFNNGVTALCDSIAKKAIGGTSRDMGVFECKNLCIVNGAQTVGSVAAVAASLPEQVDKARVPIRLISLENCPEAFDREITRTNNTQNRIERRDFVALDREQERIRNELHLEAIMYVYKSGEIIPGATRGFDLVDATVARACSQQDIFYATQAKREIGRLWDDIQKAPYKTLFNGSVSGLNLYKHVQILRAVDTALAKQKATRVGRDRMYAIHGNRFVAHMVYRDHPVETDAEYSELTEGQKQAIDAQVAAILDRMPPIVDRLYPDCYLASLFKNRTKCAVMERELLGTGS